MRDPARIDRILEAVRQVWVKDPDLRLGQLIVNAIRPSQPCPQIFGAEDTVLEKGLARYLKDGHERYTAGEVTLELSLDEAVVLMAFLIRFRDKERLRIEDEAEVQILYDLCALLEQQLGDELTDPGWRALLEDARRCVREGADPAGGA
jgi:hypothetical protein